MSLSTAIIALFFLLLLLFICHLFRTPRPHGGSRPVLVKPPVRYILGQPASDTPYECKDLRGVKATGGFLQLTMWLAYTRVGKALLLPVFKRLNHLDFLDSVFIPEGPTFHPAPPRAQTPELNEKTLEQLITTHRRSGLKTTIADYVQAFRTGTCTPTLVAERALKFIQQANSATPPLMGIVDSDASVVLAMAKASTERWRQGKPLSLLDGVPVAVKGEFRLEPYALRGGSSFIPELSRGVEEGGSVEKLKKAGAIVLGVANMHEFGTGALGSNPNKNHLHARNPYNPGHFAGGSSSGSAVCVAAGLCPVALGSDSGGSIRIPAGLCGVVGLKPTNRFLDDKGILPLDFSIYAHGPLGASVLDCAITLDILSNGMMSSLKGLGESKLSGLRVGVYWKYFEHANLEVVTVCKAALTQLESLGVEVKEIVIPELEETRVAHFVTLAAEIGSSLLADIDLHFNELNLETLFLMTMSYNVSAVEYINAQKQRTRALKIMKHLFEGVDIIVTPTTAIPAPAIIPAAVSKGISDATASGQLMRFAFLANFTGIPGLSLPVGYTKSGLPISVQLMGRWHEEHVLLQAGWALENCGEFPRKKPQIFTDLLSSAC